MLQSDGQFTEVGAAANYAPGPRSIAEITGSADYDPIRFITRMAELYGDYSSYSNALGRVHLVHNPYAIQEVLRNDNFERKHLTALVLGNGLLNSRGVFWRQQRKLIHPYLTRQKLGAMLPTIIEQTEKLLVSWRRKIKGTGTLYISDEFKHFTRDIILQIMFSTDLGPKASIVSRAMDVVTPHVGALLGMLFQDSTLWSPEGQAKVRKEIANLDDLIYSMIEERRQEKDPPQDLLTGLLRATEQQSGKPLLTEEEIRDEILTMMVAGNETTAITLSWIVYLLTVHQEHQARLYKGIDSILDDSPITLDVAGRLQKTEWAIKEAMRLYPPIWQITRRVAASDKVGNYSVDAGDTIVCGLYTAHRHRDFWADPDSYRPERFSATNNAFMPFGYGGHICVGQHLAMLESTVALSMVLREYEFCSIAQEAVVPEPYFTLRIKDGLSVQVRSRA